MDSNQVILGTNGRLYVNNVKIGNVKSFELTATLNYTDIQVNGNLITQYKYIGSTLQGTMVVHKTDSFNINLVKDSIKTGVVPSIKFVAELSDPNINGDEAIEVSGVVFDSAILMSFANGEVREESVPFKAGDYNYLSTID